MRIGWAEPDLTREICWACSTPDPHMGPSQGLDDLQLTQSCFTGSVSGNRNGSKSKSYKRHPISEFPSSFVKLILSA